MYAFAVVVLLGLALYTAVNVLENVIPAMKQYRVLVTVVLAVAGAIALDYSLFKGFGIELRNEDIGIWTTGVIVAGTTTLWRSVFGYFGTSEDTAETSTKSRPRIAA